MTPENPKPPKIILSLPRCGTHFFWTRHVASGQYQLIYDADRVPALKVLSEHCGGKLEFLSASSRNPNYNFEYNSLVETAGPMTAAEHLQWLQRKYDATDPHELFHKIMALQDTGGRRLLAINRFCYTISYDELFEDISYTIDHALEALGLLCDWIREYHADTSVVMVVRDIPAWVDSLLMLWGPEHRRRIARRLEEFAPAVVWCRDRKIPVFRMGEAIRAVKAGHLDFEPHVSPLSSADIEAMASEARSCVGKIDTWPVPRNRFRFGRFLSYITERDPILRTSLVRSIGTLPHTLSAAMPFLGRRIQEDFDGEILNNARIQE